MLGKLFSTLPTPLTSRRNTPSPHGPNAGLDSVQEDIHTRNLLFPDPELLYQHQHDQVFPMASATTAGMMSGANPSSHYDVNPDVGVELGDVRVLVMQEATNSFSASTLMCDSHALADPIPASPTLGSPGLRSHRGSISGGRRTSVGGLNATSKPVIITQDHGSVPRGYGGGAFDRRPSTHGRSNSIQETEVQRNTREYREDINTIANCMFGASDVMAYKGTGIKLHILQPEYKPHTTTYHADGFEGRQSLGRGSLRRSGLAQSFTSESVSTSTTNSAGGRQTSERKRVLLTRIFPVQLPSDEGDSPLGDHLGTSYPFPKSGEEPKKSQPKQKRTPMYSIGLIIQLPATSQQTSPRSAYRASINPGSYTEADSISSSFNSIKPTWSMVRSGSGFGMDSMESSFSYDGDEKFDVILQHYDIIIRTMNRLQAEVTAELLKLLRQADVASPDPLSLGRVGSHHRTASISVSGKRVEESQRKPLKPVRTNVKCVQLMPYALSNNSKVKHEVDSARQRVLGGISNLQVITRQGRWGIWRDEARWVAKWAGGKEQGFFFYNLLTAFLGVHTEWLEAIGPTDYRRKHYKKNRPSIHDGSREDRVGVRARTIIVSKNKMATRRLIFLLSAFLPNNQQGHNSPLSRGRGGRSVSYMGAGGYSQSPPSLINSHKEESLIRKINKTGVGKAANERHPRHLSFPATLPKPVMRHDLVDRDTPSRRASDAHVAPPIQPALPTASSNLSLQSSRTNSPATTSTSTPVTTLPHFSTAQRRPIRGTGPAPRPGSSGSLATDDLIRSLKRGESAGGAPKWQNMLGGLWNLRGRKESVSSGSPGSGLNVPSQKEDRDFGGRSPKNGSVLEEMAENARKLKIDENKTTNGNDKDATEAIQENSATVASNEHSAPQAMKSSGANHGVKPIIENNTPPSYPTIGSHDSPVKTSIDANGTINIDFQLPSFLTQTLSAPQHHEHHDFHDFNKTVMAPSSVSSSGILSSVGAIVSEIDAFEQYTRCGNSDDGGGTNVGGWVKEWHPDFILQGLPSCLTDVNAMEMGVRAAMSAEPTPFVHFNGKGGREGDGGDDEGDGREEKWVTVASSLIADTTNWTIKRLTLRRLVRSSHPEGEEYKSVTANHNDAGLQSRTAARDEVAGSYESRSGMSIYGNPYTDTNASPLLTASTMRGGTGSVAAEDGGQEVADEKWEEEMCIAFDASLVDAVERVLERAGDAPAEASTPVVVQGEKKGGGERTPIRTVVPAPGTGSAGSTRHSSRPGSKPGSLRGGRGAGDGQTQGEVPRGEVRAVLLGALEGLAREVAMERESREREGGAKEAGAESVLREGVDAWLGEVDS